MSLRAWYNQIMKKIALVSTYLGFLFVVLSLGSSLLPQQLAAQGTKIPATGQNLDIKFHLDNPLKTTKDLKGFVDEILQGVVLLLFPVVVVMFLYSGFLFVTAQGNTEKLGEAKKALMYTLIGAAIVLGAEGLSHVIQNTISCIAGSTDCPNP